MNEREDVGWDAVRYVTADFTEAEHRGFEQRLSEDQSAREAVAQAVELVRTIALIESQTDRKVSRAAHADGNRVSARCAGAVWGVFGAAISVAIALTVARLPDPEDVATARIRERPTADLAILWSETHETLAGPLWESAPESNLPNAPPTPEAPVGIVDWDADDDAEAPDAAWIREAVFGLVGRTPGGRSGELEEL